jgi:hypothetical protein
MKTKKLERCKVSKGLLQLIIKEIDDNPRLYICIILIISIIFCLYYSAKISREHSKMLEMIIQCIVK